MWEIYHNVDLYQQFFLQGPETSFNYQTPDNFVENSGENLRKSENERVLIYGDYTQMWTYINFFCMAIRNP